MNESDDTPHLTIEQIGMRAGVSRSTVSRVLNGQRDVRPEVRARVEAVIQETGYHPNPAARALVSKRSGLIGLVMLSEVDELFGDPYYSALVNGIQQGCAEHDLIFAIFPATGPDGHSDALTPQIAQRFVDGVIVTAVPQSAEVIAALRARGKRMVVIGHPDDDDPVTRVDVANREGSVEAVTHLVRHGRRRIGFVGPRSRAPIRRRPSRGVSRRARRGRAERDGLVHLDQPTAEGGYRATVELLAERPDAVYAATDTMAVGVYRALAEHGRRIPDDVAVVGFDGLPRAPLLDPALTTVVQPVVDVGRKAVELLASGGGGRELVVLPTVLRVGRSCGADHS